MLHPAAPIMASPTKTRTGTSFQRDRESSPGDNSLACPGFFPMEFVILGYRDNSSGHYMLWESRVASPEHRSPGSRWCRGSCYPS